LFSSKRSFLISLLDFTLIGFVAFASIPMLLYRRIGSKRLKYCSFILKKIGVFPIRNHYYEPKFVYNNDDKVFLPRKINTFDFDLKKQLKFLDTLLYQEEFNSFLADETSKQKGSIQFSINNGSFGSGDAEFLFNFIKAIKPKRIIEIGCGQSTLIIHGAIRSYKKEKFTKHICIEPFEQKWLENIPDIEVIRSTLEETDENIFEELIAGDLLFIDSSHIIRPGGDVLKEYLEIIPNLNKGVFVHVHDIFSPFHYLENWLTEETLFWNEQYLLEATLGNTSRYEIIASLNYLKHNAYIELNRICPYLTKDREPGSFYFKIK